MKLLKNILVLLLLSSFYLPSYAVVFDFDTYSCGISNEDGGEDNKEGEEEEEPDCE
jgi:hypothetical protein